MRRVAVYGAGAVGGFLAWHLARAGHAVSVIARGPHLQAIQANGLVLEPHGGAAQAVQVEVSDDPASLGVRDFVLVTLKHPALAGAVDGLKHLAGPDTIFVFATNGIPWWAEPGLDFLDPGGRLAAAIAPGRRVGCVVKASLEVREPGIVAMDTASARFILGPGHAEAASAASAASALFAGASLETAHAADLLPAVWDKLMLNVGFGLPAALLGLPVGAVARQPEMQAFTRALLSEIRAVARARGVETTVADDVAADRGILASPHLPSLLQDLQKGRAAEIDALVTAPMRLAQLAGGDAPVLRMLGSLLTAKARALGCYDGGGVGG
jgi:2-dehydropantoate 2-reductase